MWFRIFIKAWLPFKCAVSWNKEIEEKLLRKLNKKKKN